MKAVIMAGGKGSRLRPITSEIPKPLCSLLGKPIIFYILDLLKQQGTTEAAITLGYRGKQIEDMLSNYKDICLDFSYEDSPLGTAGGVKKAANHFKEDFIVISGDAMCDFNLKKAVKFHKEQGAAATIITHRVSDPREYGLICSDEKGKVLSFVEKPSFAGCVTDMANTGIYILSPQILTLIDDNSPTDFARDVFPKMLSSSMPIYSFEDAGYWCDIGDVKSYLKCQKDMLAGKAKFSISASWSGKNLLGGRKPFGQYKICPPVYIGKNVSIGKGTVIDAYTVLEDDVRIGSECRISKSVLMKGAAVGDRVTISEAVVCKNSCFENDTSAFPMSVVGANALIQKDAIVRDGVRVWENKTVGKGVILKEDMRDGTAIDVLIEDAGIIGQTNISITPEVCIRIGMGTASLLENAVIGVGYSAKAASKVFACGCIAGIMAAGANAWDFGECIESQFAFCLNKSRSDYGIYIDADTTAVIKVTERSGMPMHRELERKLESSINRREYKRAAHNEMGTVVNMASLTTLYPYELLKFCSSSLNGMNIHIHSESKENVEILKKTLIWLGCEIGNDILIKLSPDGKSVEFEANGILMTGERILAAVCLTEFLKGNSVALPCSAPKVIDTIANDHGIEVMRYSEYPCSDNDCDARQLAVSQPFLRDGLMMAVKVLSFMVRYQLSFEELNMLIPEFNVSSKLVSISVSPSSVLKKLNAINSGLMDGVELREGEYTAFARPLKNGKGIWLFTESMQSETASEICDKFESIVKNAALDTKSFS